jgi:hypothetical protein
MKDELTGWVEADITINGHALSFPESMSVRVAIGSFRMWLSDVRNRAGVGESLAAGYDRHLAAVERALMRGTDA